MTVYATPSAPSAPSATLEAVRKYAARGWPVFPCEPRGKRPLVQHGLHDATTDLADLERWWSRWPEANIAIQTGRKSGLFVLDVDTEHGGDDTLYLLEAEHGRLPRTATVKTPGGGEHDYLRYPADCEIRNSAGVLGPGLDIRGEGGYVLVPPSIGANGQPYEPDEHAPLGDPPAWLLRLIADRSTAAREAAPASEWLSIVRDGVIAGQRNDQLTRIVGHLLRRYVDVDLVSELAHLVNDQRFRPPLPADEVERILESIAGRELRRRQGAHR